MNWFSTLNRLKETWPLWASFIFVISYIFILYQRPKAILDTVIFIEISCQ
jgi:hypothetical protein